MGGWGWGDSVGLGCVGHAPLYACSCSRPTSMHFFSLCFCLSCTAAPLAPAAGAAHSGGGCAGCTPRPARGPSSSGGSAAKRHGHRPSRRGSSRAGGEPYGAERAGRPSLMHSPACMDSGGVARPAVPSTQAATEHPQAQTHCSARAELCRGWRRTRRRRRGRSSMGHPRASRGSGRPACG